ncbi:MAG: hypothetical protein U5K30_09625 [Acidimicrobiales bacterium]|nr:hypothetical protein [Acidimicrobiales bacterium]
MSDRHSNEAATPQDTVEVIDLDSDELGEFGALEASERRTPCTLPGQPAR